MKNTIPPDFYRESLMNQLAPHEFIRGANDPNRKSPTPHEFIRGTQETIC